MWPTWSPSRWTRSEFQIEIEIRIGIDILYLDLQAKMHAKQEEGTEIEKKE